MIDAELARQFAQCGQRVVGVLVDDSGEQPLALDLHDVGHLGRLHIVGAGGLGFADQTHGGIEIGRRREAQNASGSSQP